jgi:hypothetical protein
MKQNGIATSVNAKKVSVSTMTDFPLDILEVVMPFQNQKSSQNGRPDSAKQRAVTIATDQGFMSKLSPYLIALRPWSFTASLGPVALGSCLAYKTIGIFSTWIFAVTCICALSVHAAGNLVNTYVDFTKVCFLAKDTCFCDSAIFRGNLYKSWNSVLYRGNLVNSKCFRYFSLQGFFLLQHASIYNCSINQLPLNYFQLSSFTSSE